LKTWATEDERGVARASAGGLRNMPEETTGEAPIRGFRRGMPECPQAMGRRAAEAAARSSFGNGK
jgi:hypothetical protein